MSYQTGQPRAGSSVPTHAAVRPGFQTRYTGKWADRPWMQPQQLHRQTSPCEWQGQAQRQGPQPQRLHSQVQRHAGHSGWPGQAHHPGWSGQTSTPATAGRKAPHAQIPQRAVQVVHQPWRKPIVPKQDNSRVGPCVPPGQVQAATSQSYWRSVAQELPPNPRGRREPPLFKTWEARRRAQIPYPGLPDRRPPQNLQIKLCSRETMPKS